MLEKPKYLSNSYTLGLSARSILIGQVNLPRGACGSGSGRYTVADIHMLTQDLSRRPTSFWNAIEADGTDWGVLATLSHLCRLIHKFSPATRHSPLPAPLYHLQRTSKFLGI